ncbi:hypothetical protein [Bartonella sp. CL32QHWL-1]|uniref:hypothetical protein n=1 Tax=Bartonella sp. CL32QHWL-1 TaxID=3243524 RepID=UPI0035CE9085
MSTLSRGTLLRSSGEPGPSRGPVGGGWDGVTCLSSGEPRSTSGRPCPSPRPVVVP